MPGSASSPGAAIPRSRHNCCRCGAGPGRQVGPIALELIQGCRSATERTELEERLASLHWLPIEVRHWLMSGATAFTLRRIGVTDTAIDAHIATLAEAHDCALLHRDRDFDLLAAHSRLRVYPP